MEINDLTQSDLINFISTSITIASMAFGAWGIYITIYRVRYSGTIEYNPIKSVKIYENIIKSFPNLVITHNDMPIENELVYHSSLLINSGKIDIKKDMIEEPIKISLKNGQWKEAKIKKSFSIKSSITISNDNIHLYLEPGLLRIDEGLQIEALATLNDTLANNPFIDQVSITHRISDINSIEKGNRASQEYVKDKIKESQKSKKYFWFFLLTALVLPALLIYSQPDNILTLTYPTSKSYYVLSEVSNESIKLSDINHFFSNVYLENTPSNFSKIIYKPIHLSYYQKARLDSFSVFFLPAVIILYGFLFLWIYNQNIKKYRRIEKIYSIKA